MSCSNDRAEFVGYGSVRDDGGTETQPMERGQSAASRRFLHVLGRIFAWKIGPGKMRVFSNTPSQQLCLSGNFQLLDRWLHCIACEKQYTHHSDRRTRKAALSLSQLTSYGGGKRCRVWQGNSVLFGT